MDTKHGRIYDAGFVRNAAAKVSYKIQVYIPDRPFRRKNEFRPGWITAEGFVVKNR